MAAAGFRSASRRSSAEDAASSARGGPYRRSRSLSRGPTLFPPPTPPEAGEFSTPRSRFVNKLRGSGFPDVSLDDLADEFFRARAESEGEDAEDVGERRRRRINRLSLAGGRPSRQGSGGASYARQTESSRLRGRSVSRPPSDRAGAVLNGTASNAASLRRQRYSSVGRRQSLDLENALDISLDHNDKMVLRKSGTGNIRQNLHKPTNLKVLRRSTSQNDISKSHDSSSSHSSLTDEDVRYICQSQNRTKKMTQAFYAHGKDHRDGDEEGTGLYEAMHKEVRHAVEEIRTELGKVMLKAEPTDRVNSDDMQPIQVIAQLRRNYTCRLEESEKRKQELLAELAAEEQRGLELTKIVKELLPSSQNAAAPERQPRTRRRSKDRSRMSKRLIEEAERYFEDFLSNVEDTDFSSFDGERSETSSTRRDVVDQSTPPQAQIDRAKVAPLPAETDGVVLPWLQWETSNDMQLSPYKTKTEGESVGDDRITSSRGSWSPGDYNSSLSREKITSNSQEFESRPSCSAGVVKGSFHKDDYLHLKSSEDTLFEIVRQQRRIDSGGLVLCGRIVL